LKLPYPGGPEIERLAKIGNSEAINFPRPMLNQKNYDFSFSGLKTSVLYYLRQIANSKAQSVSDSRFALSDSLRADVAASFQAAAFDVLIKKTLRAVEQYKAKSIMVSGGVAANKSLQKEFRKQIGIRFKNKEVGNKKPQLFVTKFPTDNAAMIAAGAYIDYLAKKKYKMVADGGLSI